MSAGESTFSAPLEAAEEADWFADDCALSPSSCEPGSWERPAADTLESSWERRTEEAEPSWLRRVAPSRPINRSRFATASASLVERRSREFRHLPQSPGSQLVQARLLLTQIQLPPRVEHVLLLEHEQQSRVFYWRRTGSGRPASSGKAASTARRTIASRASPKWMEIGLCRQHHCRNLLKRQEMELSCSWSIPP